VLEKARQEAAKRVEEVDATQVTLLASGIAPRVLAGPEAEPSRALAALESFQALGADHDPVPTLAWAQELAGAGRRVVFLTDVAPEDAALVPASVRWMALGTGRDNVALVSAQRRDEGTKATVTLRVARFGGPESVEVRVRAQPGSGAKEGTEQREAVQLPAEGAATVRLTFENAGDVEVTLPEDALPEDGHWQRLVHEPAREVAQGSLEASHHGPRRPGRGSAPEVGPRRDVPRRRLTGSCRQLPLAEIKSTPVKSTEIVPFAELSGRLRPPPARLMQLRTFASVAATSEAVMGASFLESFHRKPSGPFPLLPETEMAEMRFPSNVRRVV
jgi:hypothetical protein